MHQQLTRQKIGIVFHFKNPFCGDHPHLQGVEFVSDHAQWAKQLVEV